MNTLEKNSLNGCLVVDKPAGFTSRDVVNKVSKILGTKKIGHTGTLDPLATGVLVLTIGKYTKLSNALTSEDKEYTATMVLGHETDTLDITGTILKESKLEVKKSDILKVIKSFNGLSYNQEVPLYSAVKIDGKKLYEYARKKEYVTLPKRLVEIKNIKDIEIDKNKIKFSCTVSKGTYIRSLIRDIGQKLGTYATMCELRRTKQGNFKISDACSLDSIEKGNYHLLTIEEVLNDLEVMSINDELLKKVTNGREVIFSIPNEFILFKYNSENIALYKKDKERFRMYLKF